MTDRHKMLLGIAVSLVAIFGVFSLFRWACHADYRQAQVDQIQWQHTTDLRKRVELRDGDWGQPPSRRGYYREPTFSHKCWQKHSGDWCCGGTDKDGFCTIECPEYDEWCDYHYWDWDVIDSLSTVGTGIESDEYPTFGDRLNNNHRENRWNNYFITFRWSGGSWVYETNSREKYRKFVIGDIWEIRIPRFGKREPTKKSSLEKP